MRRLAIGLAALALLALTACAKPDIPYATLQARYASPDSRFAALPGGVRLHYRDEGRRDGPVLVLVHGFAASLQAWEPWVARLKDDDRLISLDLPGHGLTSAPKGYRASTDADVALVDALTRRLGVDRFVIVGNSMGGAVAWNYALVHPERVRGLVLVDAAGWPAARKGGDGPPAVFMLLANPAGRAVLKSFDPGPLARRGLAAAYVDPKLVTPDLVARYTDFARAPGHKDILLTRQSGARRAVTPETFRAIQVPTLVMVGAKDKVIPPHVAGGFAQGIPGARLVTYPDAGHVPMEQIPDRSAADLRDFLRTLPEAPAAAR